MQIADLPIPMLTDLGQSKQLALVLSIRERRRYVAKPLKATKVPQRTKKDPLASMTKEQLERLLEALIR